MWHGCDHCEVRLRRGRAGTPAPVPNGLGVPSTAAAIVATFVPATIGTIATAAAALVATTGVATAAAALVATAGVAATPIGATLVAAAVRTVATPVIATTTSALVPASARAAAAVVTAAVLPLIGARLVEAHRRGLAPDGGGPQRGDHLACVAVGHLHDGEVGSDVDLADIGAVHACLVGDSTHQVARSHPLVLSHADEDAGHVAIRLAP